MVRPPLPGLGGLQGVDDGSQLCAPPDHRRFHPNRLHRRAGRLQGVESKGSLLALGRERASELGGPGEESLHALGDHDFPPRRAGHGPGRGVGRVAHHLVVPTAGAADPDVGKHSGVHSPAQPQTPRSSLHQLERRPGGSLGIVLVSDGGAECAKPLDPVGREIGAHQDASVSLQDVEQRDREGLKVGKGVSPGLQEQRHRPAVLAVEPSGPRRQVGRQVELHPVRRDRWTSRANRSGCALRPQPRPRGARQKDLGGCGAGLQASQGRHRRAGYQILAAVLPADVKSKDAPVVDGLRDPQPYRPGAGSNLGLLRESESDRLRRGERPTHGLRTREDHEQRIPAEAEDAAAPAREVLDDGPKRRSNDVGDLLCPRAPPGLQLLGQCCEPRDVGEEEGRRQRLSKRRVGEPFPPGERRQQVRRQERAQGGGASSSLASGVDVGGGAPGHGWSPRIPERSGRCSGRGGWKKRECRPAPFPRRMPGGVSPVAIISR